MSKARTSLCNDSLRYVGVSCNALCMSEATVTERVPQWDVADRMRKALRESDVGVQEIADYLGVARNTVSTWINGKIRPSTQTLRLWAMRCAVDYDWLATGQTPDELGPRPTLTSDDGEAANGGTRPPMWPTPITRPGRVTRMDEAA